MGGHGTPGAVREALRGVQSPMPWDPRATLRPAPLPFLRFLFLDRLQHLIRPRFYHSLLQKM